MYSFIVQNFVKKLVENEFQLSSAFYAETIKQDSVAVLLKQESPILYVVSAVNGDKINLQNHEIFMNEYLQQLQKSLNDFHCSTIIALTVVMGEFSEQQITDNKSIDFVIHKELIPEERCFHAWWYLSETRKKIDMEKSQPKDILHIKQMLLDCLENQKSDTKQQSLREIVTETEQKTAFDLKSSNMLFTWHLLCINFFIFLLMVLFQSKSYCITSFGVEYQAIFNMNQYYRIITYCFIHTSVIHLIQNAVYLYFFGMRTELFYGKIAMMIIYFFSAVGGGIMSALCNHAISVGASGAVFGLIGAVFVYSYKHGKKNVGINYMTLLFLVIIGLLAGMLQENVDYFGHIGGFIAGSIMSLIVLQFDKKKVSKKV